MLVRRPSALLAAALTAGVLTACGAPSANDVPTADAPAQKPAAVSEGELYDVTLPSGLRCVVYDSFHAGAASCDFSAFTEPAAWSGRTGELEARRVADGVVTLTHTDDGTLCAVFDGTESGSVVCDFRSS